MCFSCRQAAGAGRMQSPSPSCTTTCPNTAYFVATHFAYADLQCNLAVVQYLCLMSCILQSTYQATVLRPHLEQMSKQEGSLVRDVIPNRPVQSTACGDCPAKQATHNQLAAWSRCGRKRNGALVQADIADALIARGNVARAAIVLQRQGRLFMQEGWWDLAAAVLQRLLHCQKLLMQVSSLHC